MTIFYLPNAYLIFILLLRYTWSAYIQFFFFAPFSCYSVDLCAQIQRSLPVPFIYSSQ